MARRGTTLEQSNEMSKKEAEAEEKGEKQGEAERSHHVLTPNPCATHGLTEDTECNLWR